MKEQIKTDTQSSSLDRVMPPTENLGGRNIHEEEDKQYGFGHIGFEVRVSLLGEPHR